MKVGYVVLYVNDAEACRRFWIEQIGMVEKRRTEAGGFPIAQVGFADQPFAFELVPLKMMRDNTDGLDLAAPSICFHLVDLEATHRALIERGCRLRMWANTTERGASSSRIPEGRWFAGTRKRTGRGSHAS